MANVAEVIFLGTDRTTPVAKRVTQGLKQTSQEMRGLGAAFSQTSNLARSFGNEALAGVIGQVDSTVLSMSMMTKDLAKSKAGFAALAVAAAAGGFAIGNAIRPFIPFFNEPEKLEAAVKTMREIGDVQNQRLSLRDPKAGALGGQQTKIQRQIDDLKAQGKLTKEQEDLVFQLEQFKTEAKQKGDDERFELESVAGQKMALKQQEYGILAVQMEDRFTAERLSVRMWEAEQRRDIGEQELVSEDDRQNAKVALARAAAAKIAEINERQHIEEVERWKAQLRTVSNYASGAGSAMGSLASALEQGNKKQFKMAQALRIGEATMNIAAGIARAYADYPWWLAVPISALVAAAGATQIATITAQKGPQAHAGLDYVPQEATYKLQRGEMVLDPGTSEQVRRAASGGGGLGGNTVVNVNVGELPLARLLLQMSRDGRLTISSKALAA